MDPLSITTSNTNNDNNAIIIDANVTLKTSFSKLYTKGTSFSSIINSYLTSLDAVYFTGSDALLGPLIAIVFKESEESTSLSTILIGRHGISESANMTINPKSRFYGACLNLPDSQKSSLVRKALAIACLRTFANMELALKSYLTFSSSENQLFDWDETTAGSTASLMLPALGKYPQDIGNAIIDSGILQPKHINSTVIDIIYQDSYDKNDLNNELVYLFGHQLEHLFDPLAEYSPEHTEMLYIPPSYPAMPRSSDHQTVQSVCEELFQIQAHFTTNLLQLLQDYLIPLRVQVLGGEIPGMNIRKLNTIFPPTIDEIVRVNNIFYEALVLAIPYGSYEVIKACGISIPYFYKACMRHEAATRNFSACLREHASLLQSHTSFAGKFTVNRIESVIHCSLHLTKIKLVLDRLVKIVNWREDERVNVDEFYQSAVGTIHSFGRESFISPYNNRVFTPTGKLLVEISKGWPKELEYGWINRRVVHIFDAIDVMHGDPDNFSVVFIFTDSVVIIRPSEPVSITSDSGIHKPSIADMLMHSMINSVPLPNLPELNVVGWASIEDVYMAEFGGPQNLAMYVTGGGLNVDGNHIQHLSILKLIRPETSANAISNYISKARIMNKTQPFHLFFNQQPSLSTFATVYEHQGYSIESRKSPIAVYANMNIPESVLESHELIGCIGTLIHDHSHVSITVISKLAYSHREVVSKEDFSAALSTQVSRLYSLYFASSNPFATEMIIQNNTALANHLIKFATTRKEPTVKSHRPLSGEGSSLVTDPTRRSTLKHQPSLRKRLSSASSVLNRISHRVSQDLLRTKSLSEPSKKRRSFPFISTTKEKIKEDPASEKARTMSIMSLPTLSATEREQDPVVRYSFPSANISSPKPITSPVIHQRAPSIHQKSLPMQQKTPPMRQKTPPLYDSTSPILQKNQTPTHLPAVTLSSAQQEQIVRRKTSFSAAQSPLIPQPVRLMPSQDALSIASSAVVKDSERFWDSKPEVRIIPAQQSTPVAERKPLPTILSLSSSNMTVSTTETSRFANSSLQTDDDHGPESVTWNSTNGYSSSFHNASHSVNYSIGQSTVSDSSSVENWFNNLNSHKARAESLNSLDTDIALETDCTNETTFDDEEIEDLAQSLKNITSFMDQSPSAANFLDHLQPVSIAESTSSISLQEFQFPSKPKLPSQAPQLPIPTVLSENSVLPSDDFAYLAGLVSGGPDTNVVQRSESLYPDIRDSSLMFLSNYICARDGSESLFKQESFTSLNLDVTIPSNNLDYSTESVNKHRTLPSIFSDDWQSLPESSSFQSLSRSEVYSNNTYDEQISKINSLRGAINSSNVNGTDYSSSASSQEHQDDFFTKDGSSIFSIIGQQTARYPGPNKLSSLHSFARLSSHEIQLRSLTVNIDSLINEECAALMIPSSSSPLSNQQSILGAKQRIRDLEFINQTVLRLHQSTQGLTPIPHHMGALAAQDQARVVNVERGNRQILMSCLWSLIGAMDSSLDDNHDSTHNGVDSNTPDDTHKNTSHARYCAAFKGFLDVEWKRRTTMHEKLGTALPEKIWSV